MITNHESNDMRWENLTNKLGLSWAKPDFQLDQLSSCEAIELAPGMCRKLGPNCEYPQFQVIFAQKLGWCWVVGVNLPKLR